MKTYPLYRVLIMVVLIAAGCQSKNSSSYKLGKIDFDISGTSEARQLFHKGFLLLHSFEYADAAEAFREARTADPDCAMAYWGEAMTHNHSIWQEQDYQAALTVLQQLGETPKAREAKAQSDLEKDFIRSLEILYGEGTKVSRDKAYADYMATLYKKYPGHHEVAAFYALALLGSVTYGRDLETFQLSASISKKILEENPEHPGALHYFIHANDEPEFASFALTAADEYAVVAPDAAHALHMPSHIYLALGLWDEVIRSNEVSWQASVDRKARKNLNNDAYGYHSFHWLQYGYLQQGRVEDAGQMLRDMIAYCEGLPSARARAHQIFLRTTYLIEANDWESDFASLETDASGINIATVNRDVFVHGLKHYYHKDVAALSETIERMHKNRNTAALTLNFQEGIAVCSGGGASRENTTKLSLDQSDVMEMELRALLAVLQENTTSADEWFMKATALEESLGVAYGPPAIVKPSHELYGEYLLANYRYREAVAMFTKALDLAPKRVLSEQGRWKASQALGNDL